ncbi:hypothetical protein OF83DRAFT_1087232 [Amylostereum chailletii]|nr:hypothetical protein OF83DRAFT_1087232 [Amylostereum chailletii]
MDRTPLAVNIASQNLINLSIARPRPLTPSSKRSTPPSPTPSASTRPIPPRARKRYATLIHPGRIADLGRSRFPPEEPESASTSPYVCDPSNPRKRKLSAAQDVVVRTRARCAALNTLAGSASDARPSPAGRSAPNVFKRNRVNEKEKENGCAGGPREKPLPPQPAKLAIPDGSSPTLLTAQLSPNSITFVDTPLNTHSSTRRAGQQPLTDELDTVVRPSAAPEPVPATHDLRGPAPTPPQREEAAQMMILNPRVDGRIACQRPGCNDVLKDVRKLAYHLRIHDIHDRVSPPGFTCSACAGCYESRRELNMHDCERHRAASVRPIKRRILRIVKTGWNCLADPNRT